MPGVLEDYEKDLIQRVGFTLNDIMFMEPEELSAEVRHRIAPERCAEIRGLLQLTSLKGITLPTARLLYAAGITNRWDFLHLQPDEILVRVNAGGASWGDKERKKMQKVIADNEELLDEI